MFADLPKDLQEKVIEHLQDNNFPAAKALYDEYHSHPRDEEPVALPHPNQESLDLADSDK